VRNGGIIPLINLLSDPKWEVRQQALLTLKKILFAPGTMVFFFFFFEKEA
jgi:hypothetical protein